MTKFQKWRRLVLCKNLLLSYLNQNSSLICPYHLLNKRPKYNCTGSTPPLIKLFKQIFFHSYCCRWLAMWRVLLAKKKLSYFGRKEQFKWKKSKKKRKKCHCSSINPAKWTIRRYRRCQRRRHSTKTTTKQWNMRHKTTWFRHHMSNIFHGHNWFFTANWHMEVPRDWLPDLLVSRSCTRKLQSATIFQWMRWV